VETEARTLEMVFPHAPHQ